MREFVAILKVKPGNLILLVIVIFATLRVGAKFRLPNAANDFLNKIVARMAAASCCHCVLQLVRNQLFLNGAKRVGFTAMALKTLAG